MQKIAKENSKKGLFCNCDEVYAMGHQCKNILWVEVEDWINLVEANAHSLASIEVLGKGMLLCVAYPDIEFEHMLTFQGRSNFRGPCFSLSTQYLQSFRNILY